VDDPNADLIGFEYTMRNNGRWRVRGTSPTSGSGYVVLENVDDPSDTALRPAAVVRIRMHLGAPEGRP
jgi:hypothetical protein